MQHLKQKAEERNPDEFYFAMEKTKTKNGVHIARTTEANKYTREQLLLMKTQDAGYLNLKSQAEAKKVDKLKKSLHLIGVQPAQRKHVVFVDTEEEAKSFDPAAHFDTVPELLDRSYNRPKIAQLEDAALVSAGAMAEKLVNKAERRKESSYKELVQRQQRQSVLGKLAQEMEYDRHVMGKGRKRKLNQEEKEDGTGKQKVFKWKTERKK